MGFFGSLFSGLRRAKSVAVSGRNAKRTFAPFQKRPNPLSNRSTGNVSRYKRF